VEGLRIILADDEAIVRRGLRLLLQLRPSLEVVGEAENGSEAIALASSLRPDVVLMDVRMPGIDGLAATAAIREAAPDVQVLILTMHDDAATRAAAAEAGAVALLPKHLVGEKLLPELDRLGATRA
jgi:DNA-binding NarL/FixJ family response regulator